MKLTNLKAAGLLAGVAVLAFSGHVPAQATTATLADNSANVEWDPACIRDANPWPHFQTTSPSAPAIGTSPCEVTLYDGRTEVTDLSTAGNSFASTTAGDLTARWNVDGGIPPAGSTNWPEFLGGPDQAAAHLLGGTYFMMFQNPNTQKNTRLNNDPRYSTGCTGHAGQPVFDQQGSWKDGYHKYLYFHFGWDGTKWTHTVGVGTYDPSAAGGPQSQEVAVDYGLGWIPMDPNGPSYSATVNSPAGEVTFTVDGIVTSSNPILCAPPGVFREAFAVSGDRLINVKALTTSDAKFELSFIFPTSVVCSIDPDLCLPDAHSIGGYGFLTDQTSGGNSTGGLVGCNPVGTSYTKGCIAGLLGDIDTLGPGPTCPTPTIGGTLPTNPLFTPDQACQIDDDNVARGSILAEMWETTASITVA